MDKSLYDAVVVGAGQGGGPLASALANAGKKTALIERARVGGTCVNTGCTPTKTMAASARVAWLARRASDYGVEAGAVRINMTAVRRRKRDIVDKFRAGSERGVEKTGGLDLIEGEAMFTGPHELRVRLAGGADVRIGADRVFVNTGARPSRPPVEGLDRVDALDSESVMELDAVPEHLLIIGGGYVGVEFGQMFGRFGAKTTIVQNGDQLLAGEDADVAEELTRILREEGVDVLLGAEATRVEKTENGGVRLYVQKNGGERPITGSHLLVAAGRRPNTDRLNAGAAGLELDPKGHIVVDNRLQTSVDGVYALGDVTGGAAFTHISYDDYRILRTNLLDGGSVSTDDRIVSYTVFTDPQLGRVGKTEQRARREHGRVAVAKLPMERAARALETDETRGFMKAVVDAETGRILGCAVLGVNGGEVAAVLQTAMMGDLPYTALRDGAYSHPTLAESLNNLFQAIGEDG